MRHLGLTIATMGVVGGLCAALAGCGKSGDSSTATPPAAAPAAPPTAEQAKALVAELGPAYAAADLANGEAKFAMCRSCHTTAAGGPNMTGPNLHGVFGEKAGADVGGFAFSDALKASGIVWDAGKLDAWITSPRTLVPGTKMSFAGLSDPKDRTDVIAYLKVQTSDLPK